MAYHSDDERRPLSTSFQSSDRQWLSEGKKAVIRLLTVLLFEQIALYVVIGTTRYYSVKHLGIAHSVASVIHNVFTGSFKILAPLSGWLADRKLGYYHTLLAAMIISTLASTFICYAAGESSTSDESNVTSWRVAYVIGLICITFSTSAIRATILPYTLEQLSDGTESHRSISGLVSVSYILGIGGRVIAGIASHFLPLTGQLGYLWVSLSVPISMLFSLTLLIAWRKKYRRHTGYTQLDYTPSLRDIVATGCGCYTSSDPVYYDRRQLPIKSTEEEQKDKRDEHRQRLGAIIPVLSSLIFMATVYSQLRKTFVDQASHMDVGLDNQRDVLDKENNITAGYCNGNTTAHMIVPPEVMNCVCSATILIMIPVTWCIVPRLHATWKRRLPTMLERILIGMLLGVLSCLLCAATEAIRLTAGEIHHICVKTGTLRVPRHRLIIYSSVSVLVQIPQHVTLGLSRALTITGVSEFVLSRAPCEFRCTAYGIAFLLRVWETTWEPRSF